jgi:hypothetical protein
MASVYMIQMVLQWLELVLGIGSCRARSIMLRESGQTGSSSRVVPGQRVEIMVQPGPKAN